MTGLLLITVGGMALAGILLTIESRLDDYSLGLEKPEKKDELENPFGEYRDGIEDDAEKEWNFDIDDL